MDIRHLRYFIAISEERSLSAASLRLGVAQPSLSQHVIRLEEELGVPLVVRSSRGITLTDDGQRLVGHARAICDRMDLCLHEMRESADIVAGPVIFGLPPSVSMVMSVPLAETVRIELPDIRLTATEAMSGFIRGWLADGTVDLGFLYSRDQAEPFRHTHILDEDLFFFSSPEDWPLDTPPGEPVPLSALAGLELIMPSPGHGLRIALEKAAKAGGIALNVVMEMDAMTQIKELAARGSGHTIFAPAAAHDFVSRGELVQSRIIDPVLSRPVYLCSSSARPLSRAAKAVEEATIAVAVDLVRRGIWEGRLVPAFSEKTGA
ncbi:Hydrogen peroxide-inducible genes activator [Paracoccus haematequi]|uniref:Hydrogen peroxide-inducible genes activator n=1 Tax=Paracoccus haematequi TaxID=2491866 RepID=A0A447IK64_9RHOB|nr:LysR family transcriptional regulator [Paracoccus haematequi]VDS07881.1 Hydrogen peroxide-inducible genes activator [Paracoccus haematequi]